MKILFAGGGSGGHVYPSIAVARRAMERGDEVLFLASTDGIEGRILADQDLSVATIPAAKLSRAHLWRLGPALVRGVLGAGRVLDDFRPDAVYGTGGYVAFPTMVAAWWRGLPRVIHEPNTVPGRANRVLARLSDRILITHASTANRFPDPGRCLVAGTPIRHAYPGPRRPGSPRIVLVLGGSQGARHLNCAMARLYGSFHEDLRLVHVTGVRDHEAAVERAGADPSPHVEIRPYVEDMASLLAGADAAISRAGAITIAELTEFEIPAIFVPHEPSVGDHQRLNAQVLADAGAARILPQGDLDRLPDVLKAFLEPDRLEACRQALRGLKRQDVAGHHLEILDRLVDGRDDPNGPHPEPIEDPTLSGSGIPADSCDEPPRASYSYAFSLTSPHGMTHHDRLVRNDPPGARI